VNVAEITYLEAISQALREEMRRDPRVFLLGEDIGIYEGAFKVTKGFQKEFGADRVLDTPIAESAIVGVSVGASFMGLRPVAEMQFADFVSCGFNQLVNNAAKVHYRWGGAVPMVVRLPAGGGMQAGPFHSQMMEAWFTHTPGLKVVVPATVPDAKGLLKSAIRDGNPVLYFEQKYLYRRLKGEVPDGDFTVPIGKAQVLRSGTDLSVLTYGSMVHFSLEAAQALEPEGVSVEVVDLRSLLPYDREAILDSVARTGKALIVHEANRTGGFGGEIAALIAEEAFDKLDAPVRRLASLDTPVPFAKTLEEHYLPNAAKIADAARELARY
jgi:2-oxoisovalerate dehydrogenase E1 component beta subunit